MSRISALLIFPLVLSWTSLFATLDPSLEDILERTGPDTALSVIVVMKDRVDLERLKSSFDLTKPGFADRHGQAMTALREKAAVTQSGLLSFLKEAKGDGGVLEFRPFWITNAIRVRASPGMITRVAARSDVERIVLDAGFSLPPPIASSSSPPISSGFEPNLAVIGADSLWRLGYSGKGILVCALDSGTDANHPALAAKWRGSKGFSYAECWFDPYNHSNTPVDDDVSGSVTHGTGVMSVILGSSGGDTVGVAPGATWISANAFEADNRGSQSTTNGVLLECFEWAADPDGDPSTVEDVPRVINNSWGTNLSNGGGVCDELLYDVIDAVEAMGSAVIFSAGNTGSHGSYSIASPASRADSPVNVFAVGSVNNQLQLSSFSSRGPSTCDSATVKPEVVAPGSEIRMARGTNAGGGYHSLSGTSFSTPHVTGAVALLLEVNPLLTGDEVKYALLNSARDLGTTGNDNSFGMGVLDLPAALARVGVPSSPSVSIIDVDYRDPVDNAPDPGETVDIVLALRNGGSRISDLQATLTTDQPLVSIVQPNASFGDLDRGDESDNGGDPFTVEFGAEIPDGQSVGFSLLLTWSGGGSDTLQFNSVVGTIPGGGSGEHDIGNVTFTVTNFGQYGYFNGVRVAGEGFRYPRGETNWLFQGAFLAGTGPAQVSDGTDGGESDWRVLPGGNLTFATGGEVGDQEGYAAFSDGGADNPLGLQILQRSFAWSDNLNDDYVILVYFVINSSATDTISNLFTGLYFDWDLDDIWFDRNYVDWFADGSLGYMWSDLFDEYVGITLLSHTPTSYRAIDNPTYVYDGFTDAEKYGFMSGGFAVTRGSALNDWAHLLSVGSFTLEPLDTMSVVFAVLGGDDFPHLMDNATAAHAKYEEIKDLLPLTIIPPTPPPVIIGIPLAQNYPNPFFPNENGVTTIIYEVSPGGDSSGPIPVSLKLYDLRGRLVRVLVEEEKAAGTYPVQWNGRDDRGVALSSGIYLYRLDLGRVEITRKLVLIH